MKNIQKIINDFSFTKDEVIDVYYSVISDTLDNNDLKKVTLWSVIKYEIDVNKVAVNKLLDFLDTCFLSNLDKLDLKLDSTIFIFPITKEYIKTLFKYKSKWIVSMVSFKPWYEEVKLDINIDWAIDENDFLELVDNILKDLDSKTSEGYASMIWPYITDDQLNDLNNKFKQFFN